METSLLKTLASKHHTSVMQASKRLKAREKTPEGPRKSLRLTIQRDGKSPRVALCGGLTRRRRKQPVIKDQIFTPYVRMRSARVERRLNDPCEVGEAKEKGQMHHIRKLRDLNKKGTREMPLGRKIMIARKRKSLPLCTTCHDAMHHHRPTSTRQGNRRAG